CQIEICEWTNTDTAVGEHTRFAKELNRPCRLLSGAADRERDNIPIGREIELSPKVQHDGIGSKHTGAEAFKPEDEQLSKEEMMQRLREFLMLLELVDVLNEMEENAHKPKTPLQAIFIELRKKNFIFCCISRRTHSIIMGDRYTGIVPLTVRQKLCLSIGIHRLLSFPKDLLKHDRLDLVNKLAAAGLYFSENFKTIHCCYCSLVIHLRNPELPLPDRRMHRRCRGRRNGNSNQLSESTTAAPMHYEMHRLYSLLKHTKAWKVPPYELAKTGLYKTGRDNEDKSTCFFCEVELSEWDRFDSPQEEHRKFVEDHDKQCKLLDGTADNNVPIGEERDLTPNVSHDGTPKYHEGATPFRNEGGPNDDDQEMANDDNQGEPDNEDQERAGDNETPEEEHGDNDVTEGQDELMDLLLNWAAS
ncbi:Hypothetical predicted protein, partial [Cloeon dipterum]